VYPDSYRLIPDTVLWSFASACVLEFVKAFIDLKGSARDDRGAECRPAGVTPVSRKNRWCSAETSIVIS
jgi:hypothetical protein